MKNKKIALNGGEAVSYALKQINPEVVAMYPITPQTPIIETYSKYVSDAEVDSQLIRVESEHSALSAVIGAQASGVRAVTATASQGLLYMYEVLAVASGLRLPIIMPIVNRATSAPINIHCDHSDSMSAIDQGWMQVYCQNAQESYEMTLFSLRLAESVDLPIMVCQDGFITSHNLESVEVFKKTDVKKFIKKYKPKYNLLDSKNPVTVGPLALPDYYFETKVGMFKAFNQVEKEFNKISKEFKEYFGKQINILEEYKSKDAETILVVLSSTAETAKEAVDSLRQKGIKAGLVRPVLFRPFIYNKFKKALEKAENIVVLDRSEGPGSFPPLYKDIKLAISENTKKQKIYSYVFGLGGRDIYDTEIFKLFENVHKNKAPKSKYLGLRE